MRWQGAHILALMTMGLGSIVQAKENPKQQRTPTQVEERGALYVPPPEKRFTQTERRNFCKKYKNRIVSYYRSLFKITENCERVKIKENERKNLGDSQRLEEISGPVLNLFKEKNQPHSNSPQRLPKCAEIEKTYLIQENASQVVYWVENCKKRLFPDSATFDSHRSRNQGLIKTRVLNADVILRIPSSENMTSVLERDYKELFPTNEAIDIIPIEEACRGIVNTHVSYLDKIFFIEEIARTKTSPKHCQRRLVDGFRYTRERLDMNADVRLYELTATQAQSIPIARKKKNR